VDNADHVDLQQPWFELLRDVRDTAGLSRRQVAGRAALSEETIRAYELGRRHPSNASLHSLLDALAADPVRRNAILEGAGFAPSDEWVGRQAPRPDHSLAEALADIETYTWPAHVNSEFFEVLGANRVMQRLWGVDLSAMPSAVERNMMMGLSTPRWADHVVNWDEAMGMVASMLKGGYGDDVVGADGPNPYFSAVIDHFLTGDPGYVGRFLRIWADAEPAVHKWRFAFPVTWRVDGLPDMHFRVSVNPANFADYMTFSEWIPLDAPTWQALSLLTEL